MQILTIEGEFVRIQLAEVLAAKPGMIPDKCALAVYDGAEPLTCVYADGVPIPSTQAPKVFHDAKANVWVGSFVARVLALRRGRSVRLQQMHPRDVDGAVCADVIDYVDETRGAPALLARGKCDARVGVLRPLGGESARTGVATLALRRDAQDRLQVVGHEQ